MTYSPEENKGQRNRLRQGLRRFREKYRHSSHSVRDHLPLYTQADSSLATNLASRSRGAPPLASLLPPSGASSTPRNSTNTGKLEFEIQPDPTNLPWHSHDRNLNDDTPPLGGDGGRDVVSANLWSAAYREAVESLGEEMDIAALKGKDIAQLFRELEEYEKKVAHESSFLKSVRYLQTLKVPLERFKQALDLASPLASLEPTATTVVGVVRCVTAIAIGFANVDSKFTEQLERMFRKIPYIDECDTLGQKAEEQKIHKALVSVYQKVIEFYKAVCDILSRKGAKLVMRMVLEHDRLPSIVQDFLTCSDVLHNLIQTATLRILEDIQVMLLDQQISRWLGAEKLSHQTQQHADLGELRADQACEFILEDPNFINWCRSVGSNHLVILGGMGCGKTVLMSFIVEHLRCRSEVQIPQPKVCYYYCQDTETGRATSVISTLILELLEQLRGLKRPFMEWYRSAQTSVLDPATNRRKLQELLQMTLCTIDRPVFIVIDGLDECDVESRNSLLDGLKSFSQVTPNLKVILSSRPEQEILDRINGTSQIELVPDARRDAIIIEKAVEKTLSRLSPDVKKLVKTRLSVLAKGSAIWTKMVIDLIRVREIQALRPMKRLLEDIPLPHELSDLYEKLFCRYTSNEPENVKLARIALKILAVTKRPMSILELTWAATLGAAPHITTVEALADLVDHQRLLDLIHPFIARVDFDNVKKHQVRLVHQSVKEFIVRERNPGQACTATLTKTEHFTSNARPEDLQAYILDICIKYLLLEDIGNRDLFSEEQVGILELPQDPDLFSDDEGPVDYDPYCTWESWEENMIRFDPSDRGFGEFFVYASCHWLDHFGAIGDGPLPSLTNIESLCKAGSTRLHNWIQQNCRPGCASIPRFQFDSSLYDPLSITSLYGPVSMLGCMVENSDFDSDVFLSETAMRSVDQIFQWGDVSRLPLLFSSKTLGHQLQNLDFFQLALNRWRFPSLIRHDWDFIFGLVDDASDKMVDERWGNELFCLAAGVGCMPMLQQMVAAAQRKADLKKQLLQRVESEYEGTALHTAVRKGDPDVIKIVVQAGADLDSRDRSGSTPLQLATETGNSDIVKLLKDFDQ